MGESPSRDTIAGLRERGLVESKNITIEYRWAEGQYERLPALASELVQMNVDVILAGGTPAVQAAKQATARIPRETIPFLAELAVLLRLLAIVL